MATKRENPRRVKLAALLKARREEKGMSLYAVRKHICEKHGLFTLTESYIKEMESGTINFGIDKLLDYLDAVDLELKLVENDRI
jgi:transcriptional regulator with XRE-family HTH domain